MSMPSSSATSLPPYLCRRRSSESRLRFEDSFGDINSILQGGGDRHPQRIDESWQREVEVPWIPNLPTSVDASNRKKENTRDRKQRFFGTRQNGRLNNMMEMCTSKLGGGTTVEVCAKLGRHDTDDSDTLIKRRIDMLAMTATDVVADNICGVLPKLLSH